MYCTLGTNHLWLRSLDECFYDECGVVYKLFLYYEVPCRRRTGRLLITPKCSTKIEMPYSSCTWSICLYVSWHIIYLEESSGLSYFFPLTLF